MRDCGPIAVQHSGYIGFVAWHDMIHYAVETTQGMHEAFFGLMAAGWSFERVVDKNDTRYDATSTEAVLTEHIVAIVPRHERDAVPGGDELLPLQTESVNAELACRSLQAVCTPFASRCRDVSKSRESPGISATVASWCVLA